ncbi:related to Poly(A) RNA polymerase protein 1 [Hanseniaspora guilliermondii]|uniref:polynucleotide adenylyltransferase n=1 Tax=Hanseniaspora guilliermondii TaxID=56406 RepID=A0A1L0AXL0_9ASCO|nr:related to Poly(A) RNA polymerase protein 1 [Hanseniaspora guilliermondii]
MGENISFKNVPFRTNKKKSNKKKKSNNVSNKANKKKENPHNLTFNERNGMTNDGNDGLKLKNMSNKKLKNKAKNDKFIENKTASTQNVAKKGMKERKTKKLNNSKNKKHPERMRKSSFNAMKQKLAVFNDNEPFEEKYSDISRDVSPNEDDVIHGFEDGSDEDIVFDLEDLVDENEEPEKEVIVLDDEDENDVYDPKTQNPSEEVVIEDSDDEGNNENNLADNNDFIQFESDDDSKSKESEDEDDKYNPQSLPIVSEYPWMKLSKTLFKKETEEDVSSQLNTEVSAFVKYISPSKEEILKRNKALTRLCDAVKQLWSDAELLPFGSFATDLYLPESDIDCCVLSEFKNKNHKSCLYELASFLKYKKLASNVEVIANARIPIIKFVESESGINFDVCFEQSGGITVAKMVSGWITEITGLRELVLVVKQFLSSRRLNNVRFGGIGGFSMVCLCYSFLKLHPKISAKCIDPLQNLGTLLIEFFELYGVHFNYEAVGISLREETFGYILKRSHPELTAPRGPRRGAPDLYTLVVENPLSPSENVTAGTFRLRWVTKAFFGAYQLLCEKCYELDKLSKKKRLGVSILSSIIKYKGVEREFSDEREVVQNEARLRVHKFVDEKLKKEESKQFDTRLYHITDSDDDEDAYVIPKPQANKKRSIDNISKSQNPAPTKRQKVSELLGLE